MKLRQDEQQDLSDEEKNSNEPKQDENIGRCLNKNEIYFTPVLILKYIFFLQYIFGNIFGNVCNIARYQTEV